MTGMFYKSKDIQPRLECLEHGQCHIMSGMFYNATAFVLTWVDVGNVTHMNLMFSGHPHWAGI